MPRPSGASPDPRVRELPPPLLRGVHRDPPRFLGDLVAALAAGAGPAARVRRIHDWIAVTLTYDAEGFLSGRRGDNSWAGVLRSRRAVCAGYCDLFARMCALAGVEARRIRGFSRGYEFGTTGRLPAHPNHEWNAVRLAGRWRLLDVTWDGGRLDADGAWRRGYGTDYLFPAPTAFIHTHFPADPADQLLDPPLSFREFQALPWLQGGFFRHGLRLRTAGVGAAVKADGAFRLELDCPRSVLLDGHVEGRDGSPLPGSAFVRRRPGGAGVVFAVPGAGSWRARLFARRGAAGGAGGPLRLESVLTFRIDSSRGAGPRPPFPLTFAGYDEGRCELLGPLAGVLSRGRLEEFRLRAPGALEVVLDGGKGLVPLRKGRGGLFSLACPVPAGPALTLYARHAGGDYTGLVRYRVRTGTGPDAAREGRR